MKDAKIKKQPPVQFALAGKQIWNTVLSVLHVKPQELVIFHSNQNDSKGAAERLAKFLVKNRNVFCVKKCHTKNISDSSFAGALKNICDAHKGMKAKPNNIVFDITGGNKLMATAAYQ
jgi:phage terminase large subunit-like protein